jgi:hypothetical protein
VVFDLEVDALESVLEASSAAVFFFFFDFDVLVSLWSVVVCCAAATRTQMFPATSRNATNRLIKRGLRDDFILESSFQPSSSGPVLAHRRVCCIAGSEGPRTSAIRVVRLEWANDVGELF